MFKLNLYERWIANKIIDENQCAIVFFIDDNKVLHMEDNVNPMIADNIEDKFVNLSCTKGKKYKLLGMDI